MWEKFKKQFQQDGEIYLRIKAHPNSPKTDINGVLEDETIKINISAVAEKNKANIELIKFLAKEFGVDKNSVTIISGKADRVKLIKITMNQE